MRSRLLLLSLSLVLLYGCIQQTGSFQGYAKDYADSISWKEIAGAGKEAQIGNCTCMVCEEGVTIWVTQNSLAGVTCKLDRECNETKLFDYMNESKDLGNKYNVRRFMVGQGPSISEFSAANALCNNGLKMAVHWLIGSEDRPYDTPDPERTICLLDKDVMPVYVLYSNNTNVNASQAGLIATKLGKEGTLIRKMQTAGPVGPVIIVTELEFNSSDPQIVYNVSEQVIEIDRNCNDWSDTNNPKIYCYAAIAPKIGDTNALKSVMDVLEQKMSLEKLSKFVMLAYGINSHYANGYCSGDRLITEAAMFSKYARNTYGLASVVPYILIDVGQKDATGRCVWRQGEAVKTYNSIFTTGIQTLIKNGVIGIALYSPAADSYSNPLECVDCGVVNDQMRKQAWFGNCQNYYAITKGQGQNIDILKTIPNPVWFPNSDEARCSSSSTSDVTSSYFNIMYNLKEYGGQAIDMMNPSSPPKMAPEQETLWTCDSCVAEKRKITDVFANSGGTTVINKYKNQPPVSQEAYAQTNKQNSKDILCTAYPEFEYYASRFNVDPLLLRATAAAESGFDKCAAAIVLSPDLTEQQRSTIENALRQEGKAAVPGIYEWGYTFMEDPAGKCAFLDFNFPPYTYQCGREKCAGASYLGLSIIQILTSPDIFWVAEGQEPQTVQQEEFLRANQSGRKEDIEKVNATCGPKFNPFNVSNAVCWGAAYLSTLVKESENEAENVAINSSDRDEVMALQALIAEYKYMGIWWSNAGKVLKTHWCFSQDTKKVGRCLSESYENSGVSCQESRDCSREGCTEDMWGDCVPNEKLCYYDENAPKDFIWFIDCVIKNEEKNPEGTDSMFNFYAKSGLKRLGYYVWLTENCESASCPSWKKINNVLGTYTGDNNPYNDYQEYFK